MAFDGVTLLADAILIYFAILVLYFIVTNWGNKSC